MLVDHASASDVGRARASMQDVVVALEVGDGWTLLAVADGMGGAPAGEVASALAVETAVGVVRAGVPIADAAAAAALLRSAVTGANAAVWEAARADRSRWGMGTTLTLALVGAGEVVVGHVGDSRAYHWRAGALRRLTADHSYVEERVRAGTLSSSAAAGHPLRHVITRVVGTEARVEPDVTGTGLAVGDAVVVSTDGAHGVVDDARLASVIGGAVGAGAAAVCAAIVASALEAGGPDNVGVAVAVVS